LFFSHLPVDVGFEWITVLLWWDVADMKKDLKSLKVYIKSTRAMITCPMHRCKIYYFLVHAHCLVHAYALLALPLVHSHAHLSRLLAHLLARHLISSTIMPTTSLTPSPP